MAFSKGPPERPESLLFRPQPSPREESPFPTFTSPLSPLRTLSSRVNASTLVTSPDSRGSLQRRFTTNALPTLSPLGQQRRAAAEPKDYVSPGFKKITPSERKARQYEELLAQQRRIQAQMALIDPETRLAVEEHQRLEQDISLFTSGHQSEPTTPPDYYSSLSRPSSNRFSSASLASPPGIHTRPAHSVSQFTSPQAAFVRPFTSHASSTIPSQSVPASRRGSDEEEEDYAYGFADLNHRSAANLNRNSMPVKMADLSSMLGTVNTASFLFGDDDDHKQPAQMQPQAQTNPTSSPEANTFLQLHTNDDKFPILVRREGDAKGQQPYGSAAAELTINGENQPMLDRATAQRHRQSLPPSAMRHAGNAAGDGPMSPLNGILTDFNTAKNTAANRRSLEVKFTGVGETKRPGLLASPQHGSSNGLPKLQSSYSTNDIPTLKSTNAIAFHNDFQATTMQTPRGDLTSPERQTLALNNLGTLGMSHLASPGHRQAQEVPGTATTQSEEPSPGYLAQRSVLQPSAMPFGPPVPAVGQEAHNNNVGTATPPSANPYGAPAYYGGYGMPMLNAAFNNMYVGNNQPPWAAGPPQAGQMPIYQGAFNGFNQFPQQQAPRFPENTTRAVQQRRGNNSSSSNSEENTRFANVKLESLSGEIHGLCKDQHGCRYLQKKLEERVPEQVQLIFDETSPHVIELMTDPFGNYLCQKLLEYATDDQRTVLIRNAAPQMVKIALSQHGTRALQKMIESVDTREQIQIIIDALKYEVVHLIQDLNGNHVIQKCLNHLSPEDAQFIFDAVGTHCVTVGTHRHGCCVLQRCIDHASGVQKGQLIQHITANAFSLVQDPFGNYVVQYILDLGEPAFSEPLCLGFAGNVAILSKQKFSSNVIEKCIRTAGPDSKRALVNEIMDPSELEKLLRDSFANYVVQTAMDYADEESKARLVDNIRPIIPAIRHTPYGRRIQGKIQDYDTRLAGGNGQVGPGRATNGAFPRSVGGNAMAGYTSPTANFGNGNNYGANVVPSNTNRGNGVSSLNMLAQPHQPAGFNQGFSNVGRVPRSTGVSNY
ncbi:hypothetical protein AAFC00_005256 [Neodothiora populina]|uniref:PUM-HD domain-containing protein n=1 Tax=Neodothiora populina TaxID=2781224 RepID=A0ABR3PKB0_9PEZI